MVTAPFAQRVALKPLLLRDSVALRRKAHHAFLHRRGHQNAVLRIERAAIETSRMARPVAVHHIADPLIGPEIIMEPHRMIEAGRE